MSSLWSIREKERNRSTKRGQLQEITNLYPSKFCRMENIHKFLLLFLVGLQISFVSGQVTGTWYLNLNISSSNIFPSLFISSASFGNFNGTFTNESSSYSVSYIKYSDDTQFLSFVVDQEDSQMWFLGKIVLGVIKGRFAMSDSQPSSFSEYIYHFTGWNEENFPLALPLAYDVTMYGNCSAKIRIDMDPDLKILAGRYKLYRGDPGEGPEYDLQGVTWNNNTLIFKVVDIANNWTLNFEGNTQGNLISGIFTDSRNSINLNFSGKRADVLGYGLFPRNDRDIWQQKTREIIEHLMMAGNPPPLSPPTIVSTRVLLNQSYDQGASRDDNPAKWPQNITVTEYYAQWSMQDPYSPNDIIIREGHYYLAMPNDIAPDEKLPAILAVNGHRGSAWQSIFTNSSDIYWYGNGYARRRFIVLAVDISHRNDSPLYSNYNFGDDLQHGNGPHPAIQSRMFNTTDWEEDGERTWDSRRGLDFLLSLPNVDPLRVIVGGLSMGGGITTYVAALDLRITAAAAAGWSPDYDVIFHHGNHPCYLWVYADLREYLDSSDVIALIAPRPFAVETGKLDLTFSYHVPPFSGDKQVARRARAAYGEETNYFYHYLHYDVHRYHFGDINPINSTVEMWVRTPTMIAPSSLNDLTWQDDPTTIPVEINGTSNHTLIDLIYEWF